MTRHPMIIQGWLFIIYKTPLAGLKYKLHWITNDPTQSHSNWRRIRGICTGTYSDTCKVYFTIDWSMHIKSPGPEAGYALSIPLICSHCSTVCHCIVYSITGRIQIDIFTFWTSPIVPKSNSVNENVCILDESNWLRLITFWTRRKF